MERLDFIQHLKQSLHSLFQPEQEYSQKMVQLLEEKPSCFHRNCFPAHFTGSALITDSTGTRFLLNHHRFLNRWLQFGGHCDGDENLLQVAQREATEESGLISLKPFQNTPIDLDIHPIPSNPAKQEPAHFHYDVRYLFVASEETPFYVSNESHEIKWFSLDEVKTLFTDEGLQRLLFKAAQALSIN